MSTTRHDGAAAADADLRSGGQRRLWLASAGCVLAGLLLGGVVLARGPGDGGRTSLGVYLALLLVFGGLCLGGAAAARARARTRVVDLVVSSVLGVVGGFFLWGVAVLWNGMTAPLAVFPPASAVLSGLWLVPGVLAGLVVRRPGAAVFAELVAAVIEALLGNAWGFATVPYGLVEGLGAEMVLALLLYRRFGLPTALGAGAGSGLALAALDLTLYYPAFSAPYRVAYLVLAVLSGAVIAGAGSWALTRSLAATGALAPLASGRAATRV